MTAEQAAEAGKSLSFEKVWAVLMETGVKMDRFSEEADKRQQEADKRQQELDRLFKEIGEKQKATDHQFDKTSQEMRERQERIDRQFDKTSQEMRERQERIDRQFDKTSQEIRERQERIDRQIDKVSKNVGGLNRSIGELVETLIAARLWEKFKDYDLRRAYQRVPIYDETGRIRTDIDILLSNTDYAMAVEVKFRLNNKGEVDDHLKRMELIRQYPPAEVKINGKWLMGAMAGGFVDPDVAAYAYECGFFVLELNGEAVQLIPPPAGFKPREWA
jgi:predicted  nucleic acid-binding Zn-ribbon protein